jgi:hypothetical protein
MTQLFIPPLSAARTPRVVDLRVYVRTEFKIRPRLPL